MVPGRAMTHMTTNDQDIFVWTSSPKGQAPKDMPSGYSNQVEQALEGPAMELEVCTPKPTHTYALLKEEVEGRGCADVWKMNI